MTFMHCDRCGEVYGPKNESAGSVFHRLKNSKKPSAIAVDLCPLCYKEFINWLENGEEFKD